MKNSTRNMLRAAAIAPVAVLLAGAPAHAATDGPTASLVMGVTVQAQVADTAHPVVKVATDLKVGTDLGDGLVIAGRGEARVQETPDGAQEVVARLTGATAVQLGFRATGLTARCTTTVDGRVSGLTRISSGRALAGDLPLVPAAGTRLSLAGGASVILNRQVTEAGGALTVTAASLTSETGVVTDLGVVRCTPVVNVASVERSVASSVRKDPDPLGGLSGGAKPDEAVTNSLGSVTGGLGGVSTPLDVIKPPTDVTDSPAGLSRPAGAAASLPDGLSVDQAESLSGLLGGLPGLSGMMPAGTVSALPANPLC
jgi:hypothetical protein